MPQTIARLYASQTTATEVVTALQAQGFKAEAIADASPPVAPETPDAAAGAQPDPVLAAILTAGVPRAHAAVLADHVHRGEVLVVVIEPMFGTAMMATEMLESHDPITVDLPAAEPARATVWDSATPLSSWMGWRVLLDDPAPLSNYLKRPVLKPEPATSATLEKIRLQSRDASPLSNKIGMAVLSDNPTPLSSKFGWRLLSDKIAPLSEKLGWRLLSDKAAPLSERFGWRILSDNPAPLSSWLGWRLLSDNPTPLSSYFKWRVLSKD
jgi:hypothetical protein